MTFVQTVYFTGGKDDRKSVSLQSYYCLYVFLKVCQLMYFVGRLAFLCNFAGLLLCNYQLSGERIGDIAKWMLGPVVTVMTLSSAFVFCASMESYKWSDWQQITKSFFMLATSSLSLLPFILRGTADPLVYVLSLLYLWLSLSILKYQRPDLKIGYCKPSTLPWFMGLESSSTVKTICCSCRGPGWGSNQAQSGSQPLSLLFPILAWVGTRQTHVVHTYMHILTHTRK